MSGSHGTGLGVFTGTKIRSRKLVFNNKKKTFFVVVDSDLLSDRE